MLRASVFVVAVLGLFGVVFGQGAEGERVAGDVAERLGELGHDGAALVVHYRRQDGDYARWNLWTWPDDGDGAVYGFGREAVERGWLASGGTAGRWQMGGETAYGRYAVVPVEAGVERVGFIVRKGNWELKDVDRDRFVSFDGGARAGEVREVWLMAGDGRVFDAPGDVDVSVRVLAAFLDSSREITLAVSGVLSGDQRRAVRVIDRDGEEGGGAYAVQRVRRASVGGTRGVVYAVRLDRDVAFGDVSDLVLEVPGVGSGDWHADEAGRSVVYARDVLNEDRFVDTDAELGATWGEDATVFRVWSPVSERVEVLLYGRGEGAIRGETRPRAVAMEMVGNGVWEAWVAGEHHGVVYQIAYESYGKRRVAADIYCRAATWDSTRSVVVDMSRTDPARFRDVAVPVLGDVTDEVIYEIHVRDYSVYDASIPARFRGSYLGLVGDGEMEGADGSAVRVGAGHLEELGVTAVHLLPMQDFGAQIGEYNWGYWTSLFNVAESNFTSELSPAGSLADVDGVVDPMLAPREFKLAVSGLHARGIRVILDVVYNHTSSSFEFSPFYQSVPYYWFRTTADGTLRNDAGVGNSMADERVMVGDYIGDSLVYWLEEYRLDGFRFDLLGTHRPESVRGWVERMREVRPDATLYGEPWTGGGPVYFGKGAQRGMGIAVFNDDLRNAVRGDLDGTSTGFATGVGGDWETVKRGVAGMVGAWAETPAESVNYVSAHDNLTFWDKLLLAQPAATEEQRRAMVKLAHGIVLTSRGIAFIHGGADMARTKGGNHNSYNAGDVVNGLDWPRKGEYRDVFEYVRGLIALRKAVPGFRSGEPGSVLWRDSTGINDGVMSFELTGADAGEFGRVFVAYNGSGDEVGIGLPEGAWTVVVDAERAGVRGFREVSGTLWGIPAWSMVVLVER